MKTTEKIRLKIKVALENVTQANSPCIYEKMFNKNGKLNQRGYNQVELRIIKKIIDEGFTISSAIPQIEMDLDLR